jgi:hypothetical protein
LQIFKKYSRGQKENLEIPIPLNHVHYFAAGFLQNCKNNTAFGKFPQEICQKSRRCGYSDHAG